MVKKGPLSNGNKAAVSKAAEDSLLETRKELPQDPVDVRLTVGGAIVDDKGKINVSAYEDLHSWYAGEPSPDQHPHPKFPGVHKGEAVPKGMRTWDDLRAGATTKDGAGWIVSRSARKGEPKREKWFNMRTTGSWRLAFVLARLQQDIWEQKGGMGFNEKAPTAAAASREMAAVVKLAKEDEEKAASKPAGEVSTPQKPAAPAARKRKAQASPGVKQQPPAKKATIGAEELAGSARLQAILAARKAAEEAAAAAK